MSKHLVFFPLHSKAPFVFNPSFFGEMMNKKASSEHFSGTKTEEVNPDRERIQLL